MYKCKVISDKMPIAVGGFDPSIVVLRHNTLASYHCMYVDLHKTQDKAIDPCVASTLGSCMITAMHCRAKDVLNTPEFADLEGFRLAEILVNACAFNAAINRAYTITFVYDARRNFNVTPPAIGNRKVRIGERLDTLLDYTPQPADGVPSIDTYRYDTVKYPKMSEFPTGFSPDDIVRYKVDVPADLPCDAYRPCMSGLLRKSRKVDCVIHPSGHRNLTLRELAICHGWTEADIDRYTLTHETVRVSRPSLLGSWVSLQMLHYLQDTWGQDDWWSNYSYSTQQFVGGDGAEMLVKRYNLVEWYKH